MIGGEYFKMHMGISTGGHLSTPYADIIIDHTYLKAIEKHNITPENLSLFVNDSFGVWTSVDWQ